MKQTNYYEVMVVISTESETGKVKQLKEYYLVSAVSVTDAEAKIHKEFEKATELVWEVKSVKESKIFKVI